MTSRTVITLVAAASAFATLPAASYGLDAVQPMTASAVLDTDRAWGDAEGRGDASFVDWLLLPEYRSVGEAGRVTPKAKIVENTRARAGSKTAAAATAAWKASHPSRGDVIISGDTAVLTWISTKPGADEPVSSCDIFIYRDGHWHAIYSQHTAAGS